jgi:RES domain-containing protein
MELWRISNYADLSGVGGVKASGRWHTIGKPVVYLADHPSSALLEMLVRMDPDLIPATYTLLRITVPDEMSFRQIGPNELPIDRRDQPALTRQIGDQWLARSETAILRVPSAISHAAENVLLNPTYPSAPEARITEVIRAPFDPRLVAAPKRAVE